MKQLDRFGTSTYVLIISFNPNITLRIAEGTLGTDAMFPSLMVDSKCTKHSGWFSLW